MFPTHSPVQVKIAAKKVRTQTRRLRKPESAAEAIQAKIKERVADKTGKETSEVKRQQMEELHKYMDEEVGLRTCKVQEAKQSKDANRLWDLVTAAVEEAFVRYLELEGLKAMRMKGTSKVQIDNVQLAASSATIPCQEERPKERPDAAKECWDT